MTDYERDPQVSLPATDVPSDVIESGLAERSGYNAPFRKPSSEDLNANLTLRQLYRDRKAGKRNPEYYSVLMQLLDNLDTLREERLADIQKHRQEQVQQ